LKEQEALKAQERNREFRINELRLQYLLKSCENKMKKDEIMRMDENEINERVENDLLKIEVNFELI